MPDSGGDVSGSPERRAAWAPAPSCRRSYRAEPVYQSTFGDRFNRLCSTWATSPRVIQPW